MPTCDGAPSHWAAGVRPAPRLSHRTGRARIVVATLSRLPTDPDSAKAALDRIRIPQDALDRIGNIMPRSSLIVTDEALSPETGKGTEFVVLLSGEPQGGIKKRRRSPGTRIPLRAPTQLAFLALAFRRFLLQLVNPGGPASRCPLFGEDRSPPVSGQTGAIDRNAEVRRLPSSLATDAWKPAGALTSGQPLDRRMF